MPAVDCSRRLAAPMHRSPLSAALPLNPLPPQAAAPIGLSPPRALPPSLPPPVAPRDLHLRGHFPSGGGGGGGQCQRGAFHGPHPSPAPGKGSLVTGGSRVPRCSFHCSWLHMEAQSGRRARGGVRK